jgi:hypothetical protein
MSMKRTPEWYAEHQAKMQRISNIEFVELVPAQKFGQPPEVKPKRTPVVPMTISPSVCPYCGRPREAA